MVQTPVIFRKRIDPLPQEAMQRIEEMIKAVSYGSITLVVQNGQLAQIDKTEKFRLKKNQ